MAAATEEKPGKVKEFEAEAGAAVGAMPPDPPEETMLPVDEITVEGACQLELFDFGGKKPTMSSSSAENAMLVSVTWRVVRSRLSFSAAASTTASNVPLMTVPFLNPSPAAIPAVPRSASRAFVVEKAVPPA